MPLKEHTFLFNHELAGVKVTLGAGIVEKVKQLDVVLIPHQATIRF